MRRTLAAAAAALVLGALAPVMGCIDFGVDEEQYICRSQDECGEGYSCLRGPGCYCVCKELGEQANPECQDGTCQNVRTQ